jgi:hypothetical protein
LEDADKLFEESRAELSQEAHLKSLRMIRERLVELAQLGE